MRASSRKVVCGSRVGITVQGVECDGRIGLMGAVVVVVVAVVVLVVAVRDMLMCYYCCCSDWGMGKGSLRLMKMTLRLGYCPRRCGLALVSQLEELQQQFDVRS